MNIIFRIGRTRRPFWAVSFCLFTTSLLNPFGLQAFLGVQFSGTSRASFKQITYVVHNPTPIRLRLKLATLCEYI